ncbi:MAG: universal stress protein [Actinomycetota bacterium]|nr:universal stress protein [Actinomycetota bacterium]
MEPSYRHVLVPLDGSEFAAAAVGTAAALAERFDAHLATVSVAHSADDVEELRRHAAGALALEGPDERVHVEVGDDPAEAIARRAAELEPCLVCLSTHGRGRVVGAMVGSVARSVLQTTQEPIVAVGPLVGRPRPFGPEPTPPLSVKRVVACVDGGTPSERVLPVAAAWATRLGMSLTILTVAEPSPPPLRPDATWHRHHGPDADADAYVRRLAEAWADAAPDVGGQVVYDPISSADGMRTYLDQDPAGLVAVTTHARSGLPRAVLGSGAADIVHASSAPVLVVPLGE